MGGGDEDIIYIANYNFLAEVTFKKALFEKTILERF